MKKNVWNKGYHESECYWDSEPSPELVQFISHIPKGKILDLGSGEGRNSLFVASKGFLVVCIDYSEAAISKCQKRANSLGINLEFQTSDVRTFSAAQGEFSGIICNATLPFMKRSEADRLIHNMKRWLCVWGILFVTVFTTDDPLYKVYINNGMKEVEKCTFFVPSMCTYFCFFSRGDLKECFSPLKVLHYREEHFLDTGHGTPHEHAMAAIVAQKAP